ncbi:non-ribosomal peptide synthetase [Saccharopolyspora hirsuta]|uniref:non-ribosomal peptide synthetase n=1 Tax=Saccharopolyspora hirsuta TaxID=1837 RepID=UPI001BAD6C90|nr:amino acid adenylation domain-containing protein [Saccharopolyspora hirsuta]
MSAAPVPDALRARCHSVCVRFGEPVLADVLRDRLAAAGIEARLWVEHPPTASSGPAADRWREAELARPVAESAGLRPVLLEFADGSAELVLVAHRSRFDRRELRQLAAHLLTEAPANSPSPNRLPGAMRLPAQEPVEWGLPDERAGAPVASCEHPISGAVGDAGTWLAAFAVVLARCEPEPPVFPVLPPGSGQIVPLPAADLLGAGSLQDVVDGCRKWTSQPTGAGAITTGAGILLDDVADGSFAPAMARPCLAPPFPVTVSIARDASGAPCVRCDYRTASAAAAVVERFARHLDRVHQQVVAAPSTPVGAVELLDDAEIAQLLALGRPDQGAAPADNRSMTGAFAEIAARQPDAVAVSDGSTRLTYAELDAESDRIARGLRALGVRSGQRVGVCLERSAELVVTLLGVLKARGAYVPMDPAHPPDRLSYTAADAELDVVVTAAADFPVREGPVLRTPEQVRAAGTASDLAADPVPPGSPAYVIYTSGSTGRPKGVVVPHRSVVSLIGAVREEFALGPADVWSQFHSAAFDFSVWEIWGCLLTGGHLVVVPHWVSRTPEQFRDLLGTERVTVLSQTPSAFAQLLAADRAAPGELAVRLVVFGGEPLDARMLLPWFDRYPESRCRAVNMYGITETTVHVTWQTVDRELALAGSRSVGPALPGWQVQVLDAAGRPVPPGVAGEIHVGGAGVALGYHGRPDLTATRFVADAHTGGRSYRSGDKGRLRLDGSLEHLGRLDHQVKVRGYRIELDEIRAVLLEDPAVTAAAVVVGRSSSGDAAADRLDAYVVVTGAGETSGIRRRAARMLPDYMVPATVTAVPELPLTANGKLDLDRLPRPGTAAAGRERTGQPVGELAEGMLAVWREVFDAPVSVDDDFFELGGNSLLAVRIATAMDERGLPRLPLRDFYLRPTVRELAEAIGDAAEA